MSPTTLEYVQRSGPLTVGSVLREYWLVVGGHLPRTQRMEKVLGLPKKGKVNATTRRFTVREACRLH